MAVSARGRAEQIERLNAWRAARDAKAVEAALADSSAPREEGRNVMEPSIACAKAGVTTGEWGEALREVFGEYRAPTGVAPSAPRPTARRSTKCAPRSSASRDKLGRRIKSWSASPASTAIPTAPSRSRCARATVGIEVVYEGIRLTPAEIVARRVEEAVHVVGLSILSGCHVPLVREVWRACARKASTTCPSWSAASFRPRTRHAEELGVAAVYTPKDFVIDTIMADIVRIVGKAAGEPRPDAHKPAPRTAPRRRATRRV